MKQLLAIALFLTSLTACAQRPASNKKDPFIGMDKSAIISQFGEPTDTRQVGNKAEVLIYKRERTGVHASSNSRTGYILKTGNTYTFTLDKAGKVTAWKILPIGEPGTKKDEIIAN